MKRPRIHSPKILLEQGTLSSLKKAKERQQDYERFFWDEHFELQFQRDQIRDEIFSTLNAGCQNDYTFSD
jgi:hypothetical protein